MFVLIDSYAEIMIFFSIVSMSSDPVTPNQHQVVFLSVPIKTDLFLLYFSASDIL